MSNNDNEKSTTKDGSNKKYEGFRLITEIDLLENGVCVMCAKVLNEKDEIIATGHAYEKEGSTFINKTSYIENCETSAWGRALANLGIGIDTSVASADEVVNAQAQQKEQEEKDKLKKDILALLSKADLEKEKKDQGR